MISPQQKVLKPSTRGSLTSPAPWHFAEGLLFFKIIFQKKKDLGKICCRYIQDDLEE
jgi:hypothetical protein